MFYRVSHITRYTYEGAVSQCLNEMRLTPRQMPGQQVRESSIWMYPSPSFAYRWKDYFGNYVTTIGIFEKHDRLTATSTSLVEVQASRRDRPMPDSQPQGSAPWEDVRNLLVAAPDDAALAAVEYVFDSPFVAADEELAEYALPTFTAGRPLLDCLQELSHRIHEEFRYTPKSTSIHTPLSEAMANRRGVCQDYAHIMIGALRSLRLAARYVSGYLRSGAQYEGAENSHAWVAAFVPGSGWLEFDPTNDVMPSDGHVTLAWGRDYGDVTPVKGITLGGGDETVDVEVRVQPVDRPEGE